MTYRDTLGYLCTDPPVHLRITGGQRKRFPGSVNLGAPLDEETLMETMRYVLAGHSVQETGEYFDLHVTSIKHRMHIAGYSYDATTGRWGIE